MSPAVLFMFSLVSGPFEREISDLTHSRLEFSSSYKPESILRLSAHRSFPQVVPQRLDMIDDFISSRGF